MKIIVILVLVLQVSVFASTLTDNKMDQGMYSEYRTTSAITKGERFYFEIYVRPILESSKRFYLNEAIDLPNRVKTLKNEWKIYVKTVSITQGVILGNGTVLSEKENNLFNKTVLGVAKKNSKKIINNITENIAKDITNNKELSKEIGKNFGSIIGLVTVDLTTSKTPKEKMKKALAVFNAQITNTAINIGAVFKAAQLRSYYNSYENIILFLDEYYKCGANINNLITKNNLKIPFLDFKDTTQRISSVVFHYLFKVKPNFGAIRSELVPLILSNIVAAEEISKESVQVKREYDKRVKNIHHIKKMGYDKKIDYLNENNIFFPFADLDYNSEGRIDKNVKLGEFYKVAKKIDNTIGSKNSEAYVYKNGASYVTIQKAVELLDELSRESFKKISQRKLIAYLSQSIAPEGNEQKRNFRKHIYEYLTKNMSKKPSIGVRRQFIQMQGYAIRKKVTGLKDIGNTALRGYMAIDMLYNYFKTVSFYKGENK